MLGICLILVLILIILPFIIPINSGEGKENKNYFDKDSKVFDYEEFKVHYKVFNESAEKVVTLIHGFGGSIHNWRFLVPFLVKNNFKVIAIDLPGFGLSSKHYESDYHHSKQIEVIKALLHKENVSLTTIIGHSLGGNIVAKFAQKYPEMVSKLIFSNPAIATFYKLSMPGSIVSFPLTKIYLRHFFTKAISRKRLNSIYSSMFFDKSKVPADGTELLYQAYTIKDWDLALLGLVRDTSKNAIDKDSKITINSLFIWGENDTWINKSEYEIDKETFVNSELILLPEMGHLPIEEAPDKFNEIVLDYLNK